MNVFVTYSWPYGSEIGGIVGMSPCPESLQEYSFPFQLVKREYGGQVEVVNFLNLHKSTMNQHVSGIIMINGKDLNVSFYNMLIVPSIPINDHFKETGITYTLKNPKEG